MNKVFLFTLILLSQNSFAETKKPLSWQIKNTSWTKAHEKAYEEFIATLGKGKKNGACKTTSDCLKSPVANPIYSKLNPPGLTSVYSDCADLPYVLRAYFSWMNDLPFAYPTALTQSAPDTAENIRIKNEINALYAQMSRVGFIRKKIIQAQINKLKKSLYGNSGSDIRYNKYGNEITGKTYAKNGDNINTVLGAVADSISTASFRTDGSSDKTNSLFRDTYPVRIARSAIKPGTVLYDPNGHIAVVYEVTKNGKIHLIDAHPDNSITAITYGEKFSQTNVYVGGGFSNWRPFSVENGVVSAASNRDLPEYSLEQFRVGEDYQVNNQYMKFHEYVRNKLSDGALVYNPVNELEELLDEVCYDVSERDHAVNLSLEAGLQNRAHPERLPENIYGTDGDWENFSSPSRDARLKASIREGRELMTKLIEGYRNREPNVQYNGSNLINDLNATYNNKTNACVFNLKMTNGQTKKINLDQIIENIYDLSFDPFHCVELRWGLLDRDSLQSCNSSADKMNWFNAEAGLRRRIDRDYSMKMDYTAKELPSAEISKVQEENISIKEVLK